MERLVAANKLTYGEEEFLEQLAIMSNMFQVTCRNISNEPVLVINNSQTRNCVIAHCHHRLASQLGSASSNNLCFIAQLQIADSFVLYGEPSAYLAIVVVRCGSSERTIEDFCKSKGRRYFGSK